MAELSPQAVVDEFFLKNPEFGLDVTLKELEYELDNDESGSEVARLFRKAAYLAEHYPNEERLNELLKLFDEFKRLFGEWKLAECIFRRVGEEVINPKSYSLTVIYMDPTGLRKTVIYEVFPRNHTEEGTLKALSNDLERIKNLGVDYIWLMPIYPIGEEGRKGTYGSPYAIKDYRSINPELGSFDDFKAFVDKAHSMGLKVMIDIVYNHTSRDSILLKEHPEWFLHEKGRPSRKVPEWSDIYDLDYSKKELWEYQIETLKFWARYVDGFRCDVAPLVPLEFWKRAKEEVAKVKKNVVWLAETVHPSFVKWLRDRGFKCHSDPEMHQAFEITYDYDGRERLEAYLRGEKSLSHYIDYLYIQDTLYPAEYVKLRFLENHDIPRAASLFKDELRLKNWTAFTFMLKGAMLIYAGQEYAIEKQPSLFERDPVDWESGDERFSKFIKQLITVKKRLECDKQRVYLAKEGVAVVECSNAVGIFNLEGKVGNIKLEVKGKDLLSGKRVKSKKGTLEIGFEPLIILRPQ
ncbi:hypothetical protein PAP_09095 [Palaeococcus pacificus DY20341]|uniref:Glycosyl hydrolase family 13 catalytic domain-containing protein n=1 Tax=Palaeococcus pacificus DY20341 TaxID=1343739 RepID=A0A075LV56_9EURY|nr:alpha-amylase family glycosyl hydrolase [Palaeococcus pacificus]AIF70199.1 hypothetical protein PAP_09095 [Palaeococcus pacificus DY20341]